MRQIHGVRAEAFADDVQHLNGAGDDVLGLKRQERLRDRLGVFMKLMRLGHVDRAFEDVQRIAFVIADRLGLDREVLPVAAMEQEFL